MQPGEIQRGTELQLTIDDAVFSTTGGSALGAEGMSVARYNGFVVFVVGAVPGDAVTARVFKVKKNYAEARVISIDRPSPFRVQPQCKHFGVCGGCQWQHVDYQGQLRFKQQRVVDAFERIGGFSNLDILPIIGASEPYFYRNKMEFSFSEQQWLEAAPAENSSINIPQSAIYLGLHVPQRYDKVLEINECHLQSPISNRIVCITRDFARSNGLLVYSSEKESGYLRFLVIRQSKRTNELMVNIVTRDDRPAVMRQYAAALQKEIPEVTTFVNTINSRKAQIAQGEIEKIYFGDGVIHEKLGEYVFTISAGSFFQTNTIQAERLYETVRSLAGLRHEDTVYDLYSGTGSIAIFLSGDVREIVGIESSESAVRDARQNAETNNVRNCVFLLGDLKEKLMKDTDWRDSHAMPDVIIADPPRSGMHPHVVEALAALAVPRIVYVSCNPATQARDIKALAASSYRLAQIRPFDMFPHTYHVENIAVLHHC
ncbi:MAG: 23S rRNA (uracil(1939)-C(5))-methyltransferase RlmD [Ignavibacteriales bacterium]|nr:23S rRNA (uracil(1939)-C(5))-methyltransferase RlmD [Ignavibacteriales bacterium]